jgi:hypothetical protein
MVGITELIPSSNVIISNIYPNPAQTTVTFVLTNKQSEIVTIQVIDMMGRLVSTYNYKSSIGENKTELNVSNLKEGTYILSITDSQQLQTKRLFNITK